MGAHSEGAGKRRVGTVGGSDGAESARIANSRWILLIAFFALMARRAARAAAQARLAQQLTHHIDSVRPIVVYTKTKLVYLARCAKMNSTLAI